MEEQERHMGRGTTHARGGRSLLEAEFRTRRATLAKVPCVSAARVHGRILAFGGSAPGANGIPYELYRWGVHFVVAFLLQALLASQDALKPLKRSSGRRLTSLSWCRSRAPLKARLPSGRSSCLRV